MPVIAHLVQADEDTVRDVIHRFNEIGLACLAPRWAGGPPQARAGRDGNIPTGCRPPTTAPVQRGNLSPSGCAARGSAWNCRNAAGTPRQSPAPLPRPFVPG
ncbi:helix-turn-helix domain-containing protein [Stenotrophomonas sp. NPDC087984]